MYESDLTAWLVAVVGLFDRILSAVLSVPLFRFFFAVLLFVVVVSLFAWLTTRGRIDRRR